jgi:hypothetical protein
MKRKAFLFLALPLAVALASETRSYNRAKAAAIPLPVAYEHAMTALGAKTNEFHCVSASITADFAPEGEWQFVFYSTNSRPKWVTIEFTGKVHVEDVLNR